MEERDMKKIQTAAFGVPEQEMKWGYTYRPRISAEHWSRLWRRKQLVGKPMTELVAEALDYYFDNYEGGDHE